MSRMKTFVFVCLASFASVSPVYAQNTAPSSWGVIGSFVPRWDVPSSLEFLAALHFTEDDAEIKDLDLRGQEFRIGIARGRMGSGDWGVSFVRRTYEDRDIKGFRSPSCSGGGGQPSQSIVLQCDEEWTDLSRRDVVLNGLEVHKFFAFVTISDRVQIGLNIGGGFGNVSGQVDTASFRSTFTCTFPPGVLPPFSNPNFDPGEDDVCTGATISNRNTVQTGSTSEDVSRILKSDSSKMLPLGRVELAGAVLIGPQFKVRVGGGFSYPGTNAVAVTGVYFFGD